MTTFGWDLCHRCNYQCPYCGVWRDAPEKDALLPVERWAAVWDGIFQRYGSCHIYVSGGEPSVYPGFFDLVLMLTRHHTPEICTNLSWDVTRLVPMVPTGRLRIAPTFHPTQALFEPFFERAVQIRDYLPDRQVYYVAHPRQIADMPERSRRFKEAGITMVPLPLRGDGFVLNSEEEKRIIASLSPYEGSQKMEYQLQHISPRGKPCRAGASYAVIRADGSVDRCSQYHDGSVGVLTDTKFRLFHDNKPCERDYCPIESQWIVKDEQTP